MQSSKQETENGRRRYQSPELVRYGAVRDLVRSGAVSPTESVTQSGHCSQDANRKTCVPSDPAIKENIVRVGTHPLGIGLYTFEYKPAYRDSCGHGRRFGVMADEVEAVLPQAVIRHGDGYRMVDHASLGLEAPSSH